MSEEQKQKIEDVMHTLAVIRDGKAANCRASAKACYEVLDEVLRMEEPVNASEAKEPAPKDKCKHCGLPIKEIYPGLPEEGYVHVSPGEDPNHHRCKSERTYAEPAPKEGEKERPHQADCICRRCEDWDDAHEPAKVEGEKCRACGAWICGSCGSCSSDCGCNEPDVPCLCWFEENQVCDICQGVTGNEVDAVEPAKVEDGEGLSKLEEMRKTVANTLPKHNYGPDVTLSLIDQLKSALEEIERLKGLLREYYLSNCGDYEAKQCKHPFDCICVGERVKAAVTGEQP